LAEPLTSLISGSKKEVASASLVRINKNIDEKQKSLKKKFSELFRLKIKKIEYSECPVAETAGLKFINTFPKSATLLVIVADFIFARLDFQNVMRSYFH
jgi:hypothetical protein